MQYIYGLDVNDINNINKLHTVTCDAPLEGDSLDKFCIHIGAIYGCCPSDVRDALFLFTTDEGTPAQTTDLYEEVELDLDETKGEILARLQEEADHEEAAEARSKTS